MRYLVPLAVILFAQTGATWALSDLNTARPGATFATIETATAAACERACADDTICMAWSFQANSCELKATVPAAITQNGVTSGVSQRAPASMRARFDPPPAPAPGLETTVAEAAATARIEDEDEISLALLGGPEDDSGLRARREN
ncbi:MAG: PAN domain-containing protein [Hyphomonadaceae bacterium]